MSHPVPPPPEQKRQEPPPENRAPPRPLAAPVQRPAAQPITQRRFAEAAPAQPPTTDPTPTLAAKYGGTPNVPPVGLSPYNVMVGTTVYYFPTLAQAQSFQNSVQNITLVTLGSTTYYFLNQAAAQQFIASQPGTELTQRGTPSRTIHEPGNMAIKPGAVASSPNFSDYGGSLTKPSSGSYATVTYGQHRTGPQGSILTGGTTVYFANETQAQQFIDALNAYTNYQNPTVIPNYNLVNPLNKKPSVTSGLLDIGATVKDIQNFFAGSATGYADLAKNTQLQANKETNPYARYGVSFVAGLEFELAGFEQSFGLATGKFGNVPRNIATEVGFGIGIGTQAVLVGEGYTGAKAALGVSGVAKSILFGAGTFGATNALITASIGGTPRQIAESAFIGAAIGASGELIGAYGAKALSGIGKIRIPTFSGESNSISDIFVSAKQSLGFGFERSLGKIATESELEAIPEPTGVRGIVQGTGTTNIGELAGVRVVANPYFPESIMPVEKVISQFDLINEIEGAPGPKGFISPKVSPEDLGISAPGGNAGTPFTYSTDEVKTGPIGKGFTLDSGDSGLLSKGVSGARGNTFFGDIEETLPGYRSGVGASYDDLLGYNASSFRNSLFTGSKIGGDFGFNFKIAPLIAGIPALSRQYGGGPKLGGAQATITDITIGSKNRTKQFSITSTDTTSATSTETTPITEVTPTTEQITEQFQIPQMAQSTVEITRTIQEQANVQVEQYDTVQITKEIQELRPELKLNDAFTTQGFLEESKKKKKKGKTLFEFDVFKAVGGGIEEFGIVGNLDKIYPKGQKSNIEKESNEFYRALSGGPARIGGFKALEIRPIKFFPSEKKKK